MYFMQFLVYSFLICHTVFLIHVKGTETNIPKQSKIKSWKLCAESAGSGMQSQ